MKISNDKERNVREKRKTLCPHPIMYNTTPQHTHTETMIPPRHLPSNVLRVLQLDAGAAVLGEQHLVALLDADGDNVAVEGSPTRAHGQDGALVDLRGSGEARMLASPG